MMTISSFGPRERGFGAGRAGPELPSFAAGDLAEAAEAAEAALVAAARQGEVAVGAMLAEQGIRSARDVTLSPLAFTTARGRTAGMLEQVRTDLEFDRIVSALVSDAGRSAESVATAARPNVGYVRFLSPPSCARCAILAGRVQAAFKVVKGDLAHDRVDHVLDLAGEKGLFLGRGFRRIQQFAEGQHLAEDAGGFGKRQRGR